MTVLRAALASVVLLAVPATAHAGGVTKEGPGLLTIVYTSSAAGDSITLGTDAQMPYVESSAQTVTVGGIGDCANQGGANRVRCNTGSVFRVVLADGAENSVDGSGVLTGVALTTAGSNTDDRIAGTPNADTIGGGAGADNLYGLAGNDTIDGGPGGDEINAQEGDDTIEAFDAMVDEVTGGGGFDVARVDCGLDVVTDVDTTTCG
jgi:Ca2+-binding RTX toxin-like protein